MKYRSVQSTEDDKERLITMPSTVFWPGSVVGVATGYGLDGPGIESR